jgi:hypothetical protein
VVDASVQDEIIYLIWGVESGHFSALLELIGPRFLGGQSPLPAWGPRLLYPLPPYGCHSKKEGDRATILPSVSPPEAS